MSVGIFEGTPVLDLDYDEDSNCETDMNVVMTGNGGFVEVQGTAEGKPFSRAEMDALLALAADGLKQLGAAQRQRSRGRESRTSMLKKLRHRHRQPEEAQGV